VKRRERKGQKRNVREEKGQKTEKRDEGEVQKGKGNEDKKDEERQGRKATEKVEPWICH